MTAVQKSNCLQGPLRLNPYPYAFNFLTMVKKERGFNILNNPQKTCVV